MLPRSSLAPSRLVHLRKTATYPRRHDGDTVISTAGSHDVRARAKVYGAIRGLSGGGSLSEPSGKRRS